MSSHGPGPYLFVNANGLENAIDACIRAATDRGDRLLPKVDFNSQYVPPPTPPPAVRPPKIYTGKKRDSL